MLRFFFNSIWKPSRSDPRLEGGQFAQLWLSLLLYSKLDRYEESRVLKGHQPDRYPKIKHGGTNGVEFICRSAQIRFKGELGGTSDRRVSFLNSAKGKQRACHEPDFSSSHTFILPGCCQSQDKRRRGDYDILLLTKRS